MAVPRNETEGRKLHAIVYSMPQYGHLQPVLHVAAALAQRGHRVTVCVAACWRERLSKQVAEMGCEMHGLPSDLTSVPMGTEEYLQMKHFSCSDIAAWEYAPILAFASTERGTPDVIIADMFSLAGSYPVAF